MGGKDSEVATLLRLTWKKGAQIMKMGLKAISFMSISDKSLTIGIHCLSRTMVLGPGA